MKQHRGCQCPLSLPLRGSTFLVGIWATTQISVAREAHCVREYFLEGSRSDRGSDSHGVSRAVGSSASWQCQVHSHC